MQKRWEALKDFAFAGVGKWSAGEEGTFPADDDSISTSFDEYDLETTYQMELRGAMENAGLPDELFEEFDLFESTTNDGYLAWVPEEVASAVVARARELGCTVRSPI